MSDSRAEDEAALQVDSYQAWEAGDGMVARYTADATAVMTGSRATAVT